MTSVKKAAVIGAWTATLLVGFFGARLFTQSDFASAPDDFSVAIRGALAETDPLDRVTRIAAIMQHLDPQNVVEAAAVYDRLLNLLEEVDIRAFVIAWTRFDPAAAFDHTISWRFPDKQKVGASAAIERSQCGNRVLGAARPNRGSTGLRRGRNQCSEHL